MGYTTCGLHGRRTCWRCDRCPTCDLTVGRLLRGDYCRKCTEELKAKGYTWSEYCKNYVPPQPGDLMPEAEIPFNLAAEMIDNAVTAEGEARRQAEAANQQRKEQLTFEQIAFIRERETDNAAIDAATVEWNEDNQ